MSGKTYVVFDTETSGLDRQNSEIIQLSGLKVDKNSGEVLAEFNSYVRPSPRCVLESGAMSVNKIDPGDLKKAPDKREVYEKFLKFVGDDMMVGYNVSFDRDMLNADLRRAGLNKHISPLKTYDVLRLVRSLKLPVLRNKLSVVSEHFGFSTRFHDALEDCRATEFVFRKCLQEKKRRQIKK